MTTILTRLDTLATSARIRILRLLASEELGVGELVLILQMPQSTVSRHLKLLHEQDWVTRRADGPSTYYTLNTHLDDEAHVLWELVQAGTDGEHADDALRLASVLSARRQNGQAYFGRLAGSWSEVRRELFGDAYALPALLSLLSPDECIVDLGCGPGDTLLALAHTAQKLIGIDREPAMLETARTRTEHLQNISLRRGDLRDPPLNPHEVDAALAMLVLHHLEDPGAVIQAVAPALKTQGRLVIVDMMAHHRREYRTTMGHIHLGFAEDEVYDWARRADLRCRTVHALPPDPHGSGPPLFVAVMTR